MGDGPRKVRELFETARKRAPSIVFLDEFDAMGNERSELETEGSRHVKTEFMVQMEGVGLAKDKLVFVIAATNRPWEIDSALRRRFKAWVYVPLPGADARREMWSAKMRDLWVEDTDAVLEELTQQTEGFSGSDIANAASSAHSKALDVMDARKFRKQGEKWEVVEEECACTCHRPDDEPPELYDGSTQRGKPCESCECLVGTAMMFKDAELERVPVTHERLRQAVRETPRTVTPDEAARFEDFERELRGTEPIKPRTALDDDWWNSRAAPAPVEEQEWWSARPAPAVPQADD